MEKEYSISFNQQELGYLHQMLNQAPYYIAAPMFDKINQQLQRAHNASVDARDMPSGATTPPDKFQGS